MSLLTLSPFLFPIQKHSEPQEAPVLSAQSCLGRLHQGDMDVAFPHPTGTYPDVVEVNLFKFGVVVLYPL